MHEDPGGSGVVRRRRDSLYRVTRFVRLSRVGAETFVDLEQPQDPALGEPGCERQEPGSIRKAFHRTGVRLNRKGAARKWILEGETMKTLGDVVAAPLNAAIMADVNDAAPEPNPGEGTVRGGRQTPSA
jgi:hypothetical protein